MPNNKGTSRKKRDALTPKHCEYPSCNYDKIFQRHRIVPGREGGKYVLGNVIALCPTHHAEADRDWISRELLLQVVVERIAREEELGSEDAAELESPDGGSEEQRDLSSEASSSGNGAGPRVPADGDDSGAVSA